MVKCFKMKPFITLTVIFSTILCFGNGKVVNMSVDKLILRICTVAKEKLHIQDATPESRQQIINSMKEKLKKTSEKLGIESTANIRLIIQGVTILAIEENYQKLCNNPNATPEEKRRFFKDMQKAYEGPSISENVRRSQTNTEIELNAAKTTMKTNATGRVLQNKANITPTNTTAGEESNKTAEIKTLVGKMKTIMMRAVKNDMTIEQKLSVAKQLKSQFEEAFRRAYQNSEKLNKYLALVEHGMNSAIEKLMNNHSRRWKDKSSIIAEEALAEDEIRKNKTNMLPSEPAKSMPSETKHPTTTTHHPGVTKAFGCKDILKDTCINLKTLDKFSCDYDGTLLEMQQICDGNVDCPDGSDEKNCIQQVIGKIHNATQVMAKVEMSEHCYKSIIDHSLVSKQGELLAKLLNTQVEFLNKYTQRGLHLPPSTLKPGERDVKKKTYYNQSINELAYEVAVIVRSFASTLVDALCYIHDTKMQKDKHDTVGEDLDRQFEQLEIKARTDWLPSSCRCNDQYCSNVTNCHTRCKRYCFQIYSLQTFNCKPIKPIKKSQNGIPLDLVCDGKFDCFDESDESDCLEEPDKPLAKIEARKLYDRLINLIKSRSMTKEFATVRVEMAELSACVHGLQRRSSSQKFDIELLKHSREKCFTKLADIFETMLEDVELPKAQQEMIYDFLLLTNENMISAMKHSHFGNKKIISGDDCICEDSKCMQVNCPERCVRICAVKTLFTNYNCSSSAANASIPIEGICNGKDNCPNGEDEAGCKKDVCRVHHLKVIRYNIKTLCDRYHGTKVGDVLEPWRTKVDSNLVVLEQHERLTPKVYHHSVSQILNDLALTYASITPTRRIDTDQSRLKKFAKLSQYIMEMLKECTQ